MYKSQKKCLINNKTPRDNPLLKQSSKHTTQAHVQSLLPHVQYRH